ncbi:MAG: hypothetical protein C0622_08225 [Desulfuromonas sp.]|nr:MAG: hypothetical protein C0622_08225 [Desulfuromonas sp.]
MDPLSIASAFATIVCLIGQFRGERAGEDQSDLNDFLQWLIESNHSELKELLESNAQASEGIKEILNEDREILLGKLESINNALASFVTSFGGFSSVAKGLSHNSTLSDQAVSILAQFEGQEASKALELHMYGGKNLMFLDGNQGSIEISEPRFIEDDLKTLIELGLLRHDYNKKGENIYIYTRSASELIKAIETSS